MKEFILKILRLIFGVKEETTTPSKKRDPKEYIKRPFLTKYELSFYNILKNLPSKYIVVPQVNLATIVSSKNPSKYRSELFRNIDYVIFSENFSDTLLLIELNDSTHKKISRKDRDLKVKRICNSAELKLMTFYTSYPNEKEYVLSRILKALEKDDTTTPL